MVLGTWEIKLVELLHPSCHHEVRSKEYKSNDGRSQHRLSLHQTRHPAYFIFTHHIFFKKKNKQLSLSWEFPPITTRTALFHAST